MDVAKMSMTGSRSIKVGNESKMLEGKAQDKYQSRYKSVSPRPMDKKMGSRSDSTMSQINMMTRGF